MINFTILIIASLFASIISGSVGFGGSLLLLPIVSYFIGADLAVPVLTIAQLMGNIARMMGGFKEISWKSVCYFCMTALPLAALGAFGFTLLPKDMVTRVIGLGLVILVILKLKNIFVLKGNKKTLLIGGAITGGLSGLVGSGGPIGAAVFLSLNLSPLGYLASEATTATAMHILKTIIYSKMSNVNAKALFLGFLMGLSMFVGTFIARKFVKNINKGKYQNFVAVILLIVGIYMMLFAK